jgi:hypothetical protein
MDDSADYAATSGDPMAVTGNTGKNDSSSIWGSGLLSSLGTLGNTAGNIIGALNGKSPATTAKPGTATTTTSSMSKYLPWAIGGIVVVVLMVVLLRRK